MSCGLIVFYRGFQTPDSGCAPHSNRRPIGDLALSTGWNFMNGRIDDRICAIGVLLLLAMSLHCIRLEIFASKRGVVGKTQFWINKNATKLP